MSESGLAERTVESSESQRVVGRLVLDVAGPPDEVATCIDALRALASRLGVTAVYEGPFLEEFPPAPNVLTGEAEAVLHQKLDRDLVAALRRHVFGSDPESSVRGARERSMVSGLQGQLTGSGLKTLRDVLVVGREFVNRIRNVGPMGLAAITGMLEAELGVDALWLEKPRPRDAARWCSETSQITGSVLGWEHRNKTLEQLVEMEVDGAKNYAKWFWVARRQLLAVRQGRGAH